MDNFNRQTKFKYLLVSFRINLQILHQTVRKTPDKLIKIETGEPK